MFASKFASPIFHIIVDILQVDDSYWRAIQSVKLTYILDLLLDGLHNFLLLLIFYITVPGLLDNY